MPPRSLLCVLVALALSGCNVAQKVTQVQSTASRQEGEDITLDCSYDTSYVTYHLFWYKQLLSGEMVFLIHQISSSTAEKRSGRYSVVFQKSLKSISLVISASQPEDSGKYFCALRELTQCSK
uniref:Ig-like domain-containing protein n=1 Tax=Rattus norvegicus TaxID=10116 RepID=A0ABK0LS41_RAT